MIFGVRRVRVFAYTRPADLRKGFEGLSALVRQELCHSPLSGDLFLFVNRLRHRAKILHWDGTGLCIYAKRLEKGRFACLWNESRQHLELSETELRLFIEGSDLVGKICISPAVLEEKDLAITRNIL
jgi:transposase